MSRNQNLHVAKKSKNDECYTRLVDIEKELCHYKDLFRGKVVYCNCDDPAWSAFWQFFHQHFGELGLQRLISTHYVADGQSYRMDYTGGADKDVSVGIRTMLEGNGDFRSDGCEAILDEADIVCSNPPFSLFRDYMSQLLAHGKQFLIIGSTNAVTYKELFPALKDGRVWTGYTYPHVFHRPDGSVKKFGNIAWYTNIGTLHHRQLDLRCTYDPQRYPRYDNYDAIEVKPTKNIPMDYDGIMGVPVSYIYYHDPAVFDLVGHEHDVHGYGGAGVPEGQLQVDGEGKYKRILIRRR